MKPTGYPKNTNTPPSNNEGDEMESPRVTHPKQNANHDTKGTPGAV